MAVNKLSADNLFGSTYLVYLILNKINGKYYVGITRRAFSKRWADHCNQAAPNAPFLMARAIAKYGKENFQQEILAHSLFASQAKQLEMLWIITLRSYDADFGYNMTYGGDGAASLTLEIRFKLGNATRGKKLPPFSEEHKRNISLAKIGKPSNNKGKRSRSKGIKIGLVSMLHRAHIIAANQNPSRRRKISIAKKAYYAARCRTKLRICYNCFKAFNFERLDEPVFCSTVCFHDAWRTICK